MDKTDIHVPASNSTHNMLACHTQLQIKPLFFSRSSDTFFFLHKNIHCWYSLALWVLIEVLLVSTHNVCFCGEIRKKYYVETPLLSGALCHRKEKYANNIRIKHSFSCINIRQVPWEVLKTEAEGTWRMLMHWKNIFYRYYCIKTENICYICIISCTILFCLFTDVSRMKFPRTMLILGPDRTYLVMAAILWPQYRHTGSCVPVH